MWNKQQNLKQNIRTTAALRYVRTQTGDSNVILEDELRVPSLAV
jgi:hypothetical protein